MIEIELTDAEYRVAVWLGKQRQAAAERDGREDQHGLEQGSKEPLQCHIEGVVGEMAGAKALNIYWTPTINTFKAADLFDDIQVRARGKHSYDLLIRDGDEDLEYFVHVTLDPASHKRAIVRGYLRGQDGKRPEFRKDYGNRSPAWFIPTKHLKPITQLQHHIATRRF
jgi:hypothetical protein